MKCTKRYDIIKPAYLCKKYERDDETNGFLSRVTAVLSAAVMSVTVAGGALNVHAYDNYESDLAQNSGVYTDVSNQFSVEGTNSFGELMSNKLSAKYSEQLENNGCNVFSVEMTGKTASVSFETSVPAR